MRLSHTELESFHAAILELHQYRDLEEFVAEVPTILARVIPRARFSPLPPHPGQEAAGLAKQLPADPLSAPEEQQWEVCMEIAAEPTGATLVPSGDRSVQDSIAADRQRILLELLRPHLDLACANARHVTLQHSAHRSSELSKFGLTPRESHVADWLAVGKTNAEISVILGVSARTIEKHVERVLEKLGVENRTAAAIVISDSSRRS